MGNHPQLVDAEGAAQHPALAQRADEALRRRQRLRARDPVVAQAYHYDVGLHALRVELGARECGEPFGEPPGACVILGEAVDHLGERNEARRGQHADLAHAAAEHLADAPRLLNEVAVADQQRSDRRRQPLGEAEHHRVALAGELGGAGGEGGGGVEDASAVEVHAQPVVVGERRQGAGAHGIHRQARPQVVGVLQAQQPRRCAIRDLRADHRCHLVGLEQATRGDDRARQGAGERRHRPHLEVVDVAARLDHDLAGRVGVEMDRDLVAHGSGGDEDRGLALELGGRQLLEPANGGVLAVDVVADLGLGHGLAHGRGRLGDRVGAEIDHGAYHNDFDRPGAAPGLCDEGAVMSEVFARVAEGNGLEELRLAGNGLRVLLLPDPGVPVVAACVVYHVGSRNEAVGHTGATHLLEHLLFKGSRKFNPANGRPIARTLERVGANFNATTWFDRTNYYETLPVEHLGLALELEADRMRHALLRGEDLASEMTVVRNEFERGENDPFDVLLKQSFAMAFNEHPYHHPTIGWRDDIENASIDRLRHFYDTFYQPNNATLVLVGAFERGEALDLVARHYGELPPSPGAMPAVLTREPAQEGERRFVVRRAAEVGWVVTSWRTPAAAHPDTHALAVLADGLAGGVTSRLHQKLVETGRCLNVQSIDWQLRDPGLFQVFAVLNQDTTHGEVEELIREELAGVARDGFTGEELERARVQVEAQTAYHRDSPGQVAAAITEAVSAADWRFYLDYLDRTRAVSLDDVQRVAQTYFVDDAVSVGYFVPRANGRNGSAAGAVAATSLRAEPCHLRPEIAPQVEELSLPGGARAFLVPRHHNPTVHLHGSLLAGHAMVAEGAWTAASVLPEMLERGTARFDRMALARTLEDRGIDLDVSGESFNPLEVFCSGRCLSRHTDLMLDLFVEMMRRPTFPAEELEKVRVLRLGELAQAQEDTFLRAFEGFARLVYPPGHPYYRRQFEERKQALEALAGEQLAEVHRDLYGPASLVLALVGDFDARRVRDRLRELLAGWGGGVVAPPAVVRLHPVDGPAGECRETMPDKPNLDVLLGHPGGLRRRDDDFLAAVLGNSVLGHSTLSSRLGRRLRDREGLTYGVISRFFGASLVDGPWAVTFSVAPANLDQAVASVRDEIARLLADGPDEAELADERAAMAGSYRVGLATPAGIARELSRLARHDLPPAEIDRLPEAVLATPTAAVRDALRRHIDPAHLALAVAGELDE